MQKYSIRFSSKNEGIEYRSSSMVCRFDISKQDGRWIVKLPSHHWENDRRGSELSEVEFEEIAPKIAKFLQKIWWFGLFPFRYKVIFVDRKSGHEIKM